MKTELEEAAEKEFPLVDTEWYKTGAAEEENLHLLGHRKSFIAGANWQQKKDKNMFSETDMTGYALYVLKNDKVISPKEWKETFKQD